LSPKSDGEASALEATPFISPRTVPFWAAITLVLIVLGMVIWLAA
jgi:hypothetical protein